MAIAKSVVISCAGVGSRLGLATTKALINIAGRPLIAWQLDYFKDVEDLRIVVGFQSKDVIEEVMKYRPDAVFVYNHNYFETKTGASFYLGAKDAGGGGIYHEACHENKDCGGLDNSYRAEKEPIGGNEGPAYVIGYDGDLIVHPEDMRLCLETPGEYAAYSDITTDEPILASVNEKNEITAFSMETGNYEWTGPLCMERDRVKYTPENIYKMLGRYLPMKGLKIRACDIDTYEDYKRAAVFMKEWYGV